MAVLGSSTTDAVGILNDSDFSTMDEDGTLNVTTAAPGLKPPYWDLYLVIILSVILLIIMVISIVGNTLIILTMIFFKGMRSKTNLFITNLACADLGVSVLCMPFSLATVIQGDWTFGTALCNTNAFLEALFLVASTHGLMMIALHKFFSLVLPLKRVINRRRAVGMIACAWFIGLTCAIGPLVGLSKNEYKPGTSQCGPKYPETLTEKISGIYVPIVGIIVPLTCLILAYSVIFKTIRNYSRRLRDHTNMTEDKIFQQQKRITVTLFIVFVAFFICWTPYFIYSCLGFSLGFEQVPTMLNVASYWSGYTNSALNPLIYGWRAKSYRKAFKKIFCCSVQGGIISDTGTVNNGDCCLGLPPRADVLKNEFVSPALSRRSHLLQHGTPLHTLPGSKTSSLSSIIKPSPVPYRAPNNEPPKETNHNTVHLQGFTGNGNALYQEEMSSDDDDVFISDSAMKRSNSETDKEKLERRHFDLSPKVRDRFAYRSDPGKIQAKRSNTRGRKPPEQGKKCITSSKWEPDAKARRALLGRSTMV